MKFFKSKFFIITLCVAVVLCIFTSVFYALGVTNFVKTVVGDIFSPVQKLVYSVKNALEGYSMYLSDMDSLIEENSKLKDEIQSLEDELANAQYAKDENERLRDYMSIAQNPKYKEQNFTMTDAMIIGAQGDNYNSIIKINKGEADGIAVNMPVIVANRDVGEGVVVGAVCEVGGNWANVRVICESSSGAGGYISRNGVIGVLQGDVIYRDEGVLKLSYLDADADIKIGDDVYTSGSGSVYPAGLYIGKVSSVGVDEYTRSQIATVTCSADFSSLTYVMVITGFDAKELG